MTWMVICVLTFLIVGSLRSALQLSPTSRRRTSGPWSKYPPWALDLHRLIAWFVFILSIVVAAAFASDSLRN